MFRLLVNVRRALMKSSKRRVADESALGRGDGVERDGSLERRRPDGGLLIMRSLVALLGCVSPHQFNADEGLWLSGEISRASERDYLMVVYLIEALGESNLPKGGCIFVRRKAPLRPYLTLSLSQGECLWR